MDKTIITCAVTGGGAITERSAYVPITPEQIANASIEAARAGAAIVHVHVRDPDTGAASMRLDLYREVVDRIRASDVDVVINLTGGLGGRYVPSQADPAVAGPGTQFVAPERRVEHMLELRPEIGTLDIGSLNFGQYAVLNTPAHTARMAALMQEAGVKPELEVFELGGIRYARHLLEKGQIASPPLFQLCLGVPWGADADTETMLAMRNHLPADAAWGAFGVSKTNWAMVAQAAILGGNVRVGLEDSLYLDRGVLAQSNAALVERAVAILQNLNRPIATPAEARTALGLRRSV